MRGAEKGYATDTAQKGSHLGLNRGTVGGYP